MLQLNNDEYEKLRKYIYDNYGINLNSDKKSLVFSRLRSLIIEMELNSFEEYYKLLISDKTGKIASGLINRISTNHTFFMREKEHFDYLFNTVLPYIEKKYEKTKDVKLWCAACSSGEEAYTLQIILKEFFENKGDWNTQMLASDVSTDVLATAYKGVYSKESLKSMPFNWIEKYFEKFDNDYMAVKPFIKNNMLFRKINLIDSKLNTKFRKKFQIIFCRNVMIYFNEQTRENLVNTMYDLIEPGGYLFVGHSESLNYNKSKFKYILPAVYRKE